MKEEEIRKREVFNKYLDLVKKDVEDYFIHEQFINVLCPACHSGNHIFAFKKNGFNYVSCSNCDTLFVNPRPSFSLLEDFYAHSPSTSFWVNQFFKPVAKARREKIFKPRAQYISEEFSHLSKSKIGDIGAGFGMFLEELREFWPEADLYAIEPSVEMVQICQEKSLKVIPTSVENTEKNQGNFDLLTAFELFEHLYCPEQFLKKVWDLLKPEGYLLLTTLNGQGFDIQVLWEKSKSVSPPHHLNFFNPTSIELLLKANGFILEKIETPGKLDWDIVEGMYRKENVSLERFWKLLDSKDESIKTSFQDWLVCNKLSSHMRLIAKKALP